MAIGRLGEAGLATVASGDKQVAQQSVVAQALDGGAGENLSESGIIQVGEIGQAGRRCLRSGKEPVVVRR